MWPRFAVMSHKTFTAHVAPTVPAVGLGTTYVTEALLALTARLVHHRVVLVITLGANDFQNTIVSGVFFINLEHLSRIVQHIGPEVLGQLQSSPHLNLPPLEGGSFAGVFDPILIVVESGAPCAVDTSMSLVGEH